MRVTTGLSRSHQSGATVTDITSGHIGRVLCVAFDKSCGEDYVCVSHPDRTPGVIDRYLAAIYIWHFAHVGIELYK